MNPLDWLNPWAQPPQDPRMLPSPGASVFRNDAAGPTQQYKGDQLPFTPRPQAIPGQPMYEARAGGPSERAGLPAPSNYGPEDTPPASFYTDGLSAEESNAMVAGQEDPQVTNGGQDVQISPASQNAGDPTDVTGNMDAGTQDPENAPVESYNSDKKDSLNLSSPSWGKFMSNPGASDALLGFAEGMLSAPNFLAGLGKGAGNFGRALKPYEPMSDAEKERLTYVSRLKAAVAAAGKTGSTGKYVTFSSGYTPDGTTISTRNNNVSGKKEYHVDGKWTEQVPNGFIPRQDSGVGKYNQEMGKNWGERAYKFESSAMESRENIGRYQEAFDLVEKAGIGPDIWSQTGRLMTEKLNWKALEKITGIDPDATQRYKQIVRKMELDAAEAMEGQGQITEAERQILREGINSENTTPETARRFFQVMMAYEKRKTEKMGAWQVARQQNPNKSFESFEWEWQDYINKTYGGERYGVPGETPSDPARPAPAAAGNTTPAPSPVRTEAEAILRRATPPPQ